MSNDEDRRMDDATAGEAVSFPFDRMTAQRFRETFPRARWSEEKKAWFVPGSTARRRIDRWLAREASRTEPFADERGRDAYNFEPILSPYLNVGDIGFWIRTPYSRTAVEELRQVPFARWESAKRAWLVPFSSYDELLRRWKTIEEAALRNEPDERRKRAAARKGTQEEAYRRRRAAERRRHRLPIAGNDPPPLGRPVATNAYGIVLIVEVTGEIVDPEIAQEFYPYSKEAVWALWRSPTLDELVHTWPSRTRTGDDERSRGWWQPTLDELREARKSARSRERRLKQPDGS